MAIGDYSKINFVNGQPPAISAINLNKIDSKVDEIDKALLNIEPTVEWSDIENKPTTFTPSIHSHAWNDIESKPTTFTPATHSHAWADITSKPAFGTTGGTIAEGNHNHDSEKAYGMIYEAAQRSYKDSTGTGVNLIFTSSANISGVTTGTNSLIIETEGTYEIVCNLSVMFPATTTNYTFYVTKNNVKIPGIIFDTASISSARYFAISMSGLTNLVNSDVIRVLLESSVSTDSIAIRHTNLYLKRIA